MQTQILHISENLKVIFIQGKEINYSLEHVVLIAEESSSGADQISASIQQSTSVMDDSLFRICCEISRRIKSLS